MNLFAECDVCLVGGGTAGTVAAIAAARMGANTLLVESSYCLGGTSTAGLVDSYISFHDASGKKVVKGIAQEIVDRLMRVRASNGHVEDLIIRDSYSRTHYEVEALKWVLTEMSEEAGVKPLFGSFVDEVLLHGQMCKGVFFSNKKGRQLVLSEVCIDATGDGDVAFFAGAHVEKENKQKLQPATMMFRMGNIRVSDLIVYMKEHPSQFKLAIPAADLDKQPVLWNTLELFPPLVEACKRGELPEGITPRQAWFAMSKSQMKRGEATINFCRVDNIDGTDPKDLSKAELIGRRQVAVISQFLRNNLPGFTSAHVIDSADRIGVRETRRVVGEYTLTKEDVLEQRTFDDVVARGATPLDIHGGHNERGQMFWIKTHDRGIMPYDIPYRALIPQSIDNLIVAGRCISATHEAQGAIRMMPICMATGQAAGTAAALSARLKTKPRDLDIAVLQEQLTKNKLY